jgi:hypothetical protein
MSLQKKRGRKNNVKVDECPPVENIISSISKNIIQQLALVDNKHTDSMSSSSINKENLTSNELSNELPNELPNELSNELDENLSDQKGDKKRGRKPKSKQKSYSVQGSIVNNINNVISGHEHVILHFPFKAKEVYKGDPFSSCQEIKYNPNISEPEPFAPDCANNFSSINNQCNENINQTFFNLDENRKTLINVQNKIGGDNENILSYVNPEYSMEITSQKKIKEIDDIIETEQDPIGYLDKEVYVQQNVSLFNNEKIIMKKNLNKIQYDFLDSNIKGEWPLATNIYCMWCCHSFEGPPCAIPTKFVEGKFFVQGCFCSFNCAAAYNFQDSKSGDLWERYSLLNLLYKMIYDKPFTKIKPAPPREVLTIFGGYLNIDDYRKNMLQNVRDYRIIKPPIVSMVPKVEESIIEFNTSNPVLVDQEKMNIAAEKLRLKRKKPLMNNTQTLENFMDMTYIN